MTLHQLSIGDSAVVKNITDPNLAVMLNEYGILPGSLITLAGKAPLGDPLCIQTPETQVSIRKGDAAQIWVEEISE